MNRNIFLVFIFINFVSSVFSQNKPLELIQAGELEGGNVNGRTVRKLRQNVIFKQGDTKMWCDSAYQYVDNNEVEAFGHVKLLKNDGSELKGNHLKYDASNRWAVITDNVTLVDKSMKLSAPILEFSMLENIMTYPNGAKIVDGENVLTSDWGNYNTVSKIATFKRNVKLVNPEYTTLSDTLIYNSSLKTAFFKGPTNIVSKKGNKLYAEDGSYNSITKKAIFKGRARIETAEFILEGDSIDYNEKNKEGIAKRNVVITSKKDSSIITGDYGYYLGKKGLAKVYGKQACLTSFSKGDTMIMWADTLISINDSIKNEKKVLAFKKVKIFRNDMQGKCDSLSYNLIDSLIVMFRDPVLWSNKSQLSADTVRILMKKGKIDKLIMRVNSFIVSLDSVRNYNQVKGKHMVANFYENKLQKVDVNGNGESIYFALEDTVTTGMNKILCSTMQLRFLENKLQTISFVSKPDATFIPPHELSEPDRRLKGFRWRIAEIPTRNNR